MGRGVGGLLEDSDKEAAGVLEVRQDAHAALEVHVGSLLGRGRKAAGADELAEPRWHRRRGGCEVGGLGGPGALVEVDAPRADAGGAAELGQLCRDVDEAELAAAGAQQLGDNGLVLDGVERARAVDEAAAHFQ